MVKLGWVTADEIEAGSTCRVNSDQIVQTCSQVFLNILLNTTTKKANRYN